MKDNVRPFVKKRPQIILPPQRLSTGKAAPTLVRWIGSDLITGPLNDRLNRRVRRTAFPEESIAGSFKIETQGENLYFQFSVNGETESFVLPDWRKIHGEESIARIRALPWKLFQSIFGMLDRVKSRRSTDDDLFVNVYPDLMHPAPRGSHDLTYFSVFYWLVLPAWQHGKKAYNKTRAFSTWRATVKDEIETKLLSSAAAAECMPRDASVFDELIERFKRPEHSDDMIALQARVRDRRIPGNAEQLALDYAAHLCGVPLYGYSIRQLQQLKSNSPKRR